MTRLSCLRMAVLLMPLIAGGCSGGMAAYPSLAQRPAERAFAQQVPATPAREAVAAPEATLVQQIATLHGDADKANSTFAERARAAGRAAQAAHGTAPGSEAWATATVAMAGLDGARSDTALALANLDALRAKTAVASAQRNDAQGVANYAAVTTADRAVAAILAQQDATIASLHKTIEN